MEANYFFIDGSALNAQIRHLWRTEKSLAGRKLCPKHLIDYFMDCLGELHSGSYKRATFYFPSGDDDNVAAHLVVPDYKQSGRVRDLNFKYCGERLKKSAAFDDFVQTSVPAKFQSRFSKSEKGIDIEICCDAFRLAASGKLERLFLLTNDDDFVPLVKILRDYGANVSIIHLTDTITGNSSLLKEADSYDAVGRDNWQAMFFPLPAADEGQVSEKPDLSALKPEAEPSDLSLDDAPVATERPSSGLTKGS